MDLGWCRMRFQVSVITTVLIVLTPCGVGWAESPEEKGLAIAVEADHRDQGFTDSSATLEMILTNRHGESSNRELRLKTLEVIDPNLGDKSLTIFDRPRDVKGTAFLSFTKIEEPDDQWLYLPALKRVKRISSANKSGPFMGSEFAYEDLASQEVGKYNYKWLRDDMFDGLECFVVEQYPVYENSGYTKRVVWIDQKEFRPLKIEFYDRKAALLKTMFFNNYKQYLGQFWRSQEMFVENHLTGKTTTLKFSNFVFQAGLTERDFNKNALSRAR